MGNGLMTLARATIVVDSHARRLAGHESLRDDSLDSLDGMP
jgi:hypothetical protein